jgi:hypothetical protein
MVSMRYQSVSENIDASLIVAMGIEVSTSALREPLSAARPHVA